MANTQAAQGRHSTSASDRRACGTQTGRGQRENHKQPGWCQPGPQVVGAPATKMGKPGASTSRGDTGSQGRATPPGSQIS